ncbi:ketosteroid isomerase-like protein [Bradyrhizobium sp. S3.14.4]|jgi:ketosteroid isomerase-like protein
MTKLDAQWDAAINDPNFDALLPMYAADASLMPPGAAPLDLRRYATSLPKEARASEITSLSL